MKLVLVDPKSCTKTTVELSGEGNSRVNRPAEYTEQPRTIKAGRTFTAERHKVLEASSGVACSIRQFELTSMSNPISLRDSSRSRSRSGGNGCPRMCDNRTTIPLKIKMDPRYNCFDSQDEISSKTVSRRHEWRRVTKDKQLCRSGCPRKALDEALNAIGRLPQGNKPLVFVPGGLEEDLGSVVYTKSWKSSLVFDGSKPSGPSFKLVSGPSGRGAFNIHNKNRSRRIDPNFHFNYNSLGNMKMNPH